VWGEFRLARASAEASGGASSLVGVLVKKSSDFVQKVPPSFTFSEIERCCLGASRLGMVFFPNFEGIFEIAWQVPIILDNRVHLDLAGVVLGDRM